MELLSYKTLLGLETQSINPIYHYSVSEIIYYIFFTFLDYDWPY